MAPKITVITPVYNPGRFIERCINSLLAQTMPAGDFEVLFVDDGSTDATPARLDALAREHKHVRVIHQENSGWPGKPRNVGMDEALGDYVQFLDQDDELGPEALERMYAIAARNDADIVLGKVTSDFRGVPHFVFRRTVERCTAQDAPLMESVTPHKMFRRAFLDEHRFRYPEGKRRLEDQLFMAQTYLAAKSVSIVGDYPCYFYKKRADGKNAGSVRIDPPGYYGNLREVVDAVVSATEPGEFRNQQLRRFYRVEMLGRISEPSMPTYADDYRRSLYAEVRKIALECFPDEVPDGLPSVPRVRSVLLREDRMDDLVEMAKRCKSIGARTTLESLEWRAGRLMATLSAELIHGDGDPVVVVERAGRYFLDPRIVGGAVGDEWTDATDDLADAQVEAFVRERESAIEWFLPGDLPLTLERSGAGGGDRRRLLFRGSVEIDPMTLHGGRPLPKGAWDVTLRVKALGLGKRVRVGAERAPTADRGALPALLGDPARLVLPYWTDEFGNLTVDLDERNKSWAKAVASRGVGKARVQDGRLSATLPVVTHGTPASASVQIVLDQEGPGSACWLPGRVEAQGDQVQLVSDITSDVPGPVGLLRSGEYRLSMKTADPRRAAEVVGTVEVVEGRAADAVAHRPPRRQPGEVMRDAVGTGVRHPTVMRLARRTLAALPPDKAQRMRATAERMLRTKKP
ncbi:MAG: glycosyltransferase [Actinomycetes bacterium]